MRSAPSPMVMRAPVVCLAMASVAEVPAKHRSVRPHGGGLAREMSIDGAATDLERRATAATVVLARPKRRSTSWALWRIRSGVGVCSVTSRTSPTARCREMPSAARGAAEGATIELLFAGPWAFAIGATTIVGGVAGACDARKFGAGR
jgi:hypothetical protein